jgi:hypothetical protein
MQQLSTQAQTIEFLPATDPLWRNTPTPWVAHYCPLGIPMTVETNAPLLWAYANEVFGYWEPSDGAAAAPPLRLRLLLHDVAEELPSHIPPPVMRSMDRYFLLSLGQSQGFADRRAGCAVTYITPALMAHPETVCACFVECPGMFLACGSHRIPLHAAGLMWAGRGVLLTGQDGAGKSTLAYACLRAGFRLLAEDIVYAPAPQAGEEHTVWGDGRLLHLLPDAPRFFPELHNAPCVQQLNHETKLRVRVGERWPDAPLMHMPVWGVCSLARSGSSVTRMLPADSAELRYALTYFKGDPPLDATAQQGAAERLLSVKTARMEVGSDLDQAVTLLKRWLEQDRA